MCFSRVAGFAGIGFVAVLLAANVILTAAGFPTPSEEVTPGAIDAAPGGLRLASALLPAAWLLSVIFAAGLYAHLRPAAGQDPWALTGLAGVLMQSVTFTGVEATRLALLAGGWDDTGLWGLHTALFAFNQVFLATALLGFSMAGRRAGAIARWHAGLGLLAAGSLFAAATAGPYGVGGVNPLAPAGLIGWLLWLVWIVAFGVVLLKHREGRTVT